MLTSHFTFYDSDISIQDDNDLFDNNVDFEKGKAVQEQPHDPIEDGDMCFPDNDEDKRFFDVLVAVPAPVNEVDYYSDDSSSNYYSNRSSFDSGYLLDSKEGEGHAHKVSISQVVISDDEPEQEMQMVAPIVNAREGDRFLPINIELLPHAPLVPKQEVVAAEEDKSKKSKKEVVVPDNVHRSERLKILNK
ncbi:hypothetical protein ZWY2020_011341 [Hordeum vulgare]|nr:hypothetical protein ZWY2020_011341 [Hordeum vulgare]